MGADEEATEEKTGVRVEVEGRMEVRGGKVDELFEVKAEE